MNVNDIHTFIKSNNKDKVAENTLLYIYYVYYVTCHGVAPGLESRYTFLHKANVSMPGWAVLGWAGWCYDQTLDPRQVKLEAGHDTKIT